jgi:hypothetical protein
VKNTQVPPQTSNPALVTVTVTGSLLAPLANNDTASAVIGSAVTVNVLANDAAGSSAINPASVTVASAPANGAAAANLSGTITYTPALNFSGTDSFSYTVRNAAGLQSNAATVTVTVAAAPAEAVAVSRAQFTLNGATWRIDGTVTPAPAAGTTLTIYNNATVGTAPLISNLAVGGNGSFTWSSPSNSPQPNTARRISIQSNQVPATKLENVTVTVR